MNDPKKLNGWTAPMMLTLRDRFVQHAKVQSLMHIKRIKILINCKFWRVFESFQIVNSQYLYLQDPETKVLILTGADPYYCAGVNLSATIQPMHPKKLHNMIRTQNQAVFDAFLDFPKPIIVAANGPAIGACVTSASTCDAISKYTTI